jgi:hypothetical protein
MKWERSGRSTPPPMSTSRRSSRRYSA